MTELAASYVTGLVICACGVWLSDDVEEGDHGLVALLILVWPFTLLASIYGRLKGRGVL